MINNSNYFELTGYMSVSQFHDFVGSPAFPGCEARAMAKLRKEWHSEPNEAMLIGSYIDAYFSNEMPDFQKRNPEIFKKDGTLKAAFEHANKIIEVAKADHFFYKYISGVPQKIFTGEIFGVQWKGKIDFLHEGKAIVDLKVVKNINDQTWLPEIKQKANFIYSYGYLHQAAIYQKLVQINTGVQLPFYIAALTKEEYPDKAIIQIPQQIIDQSLTEIELKIEHVNNVKTGIEQPKRCEVCNYCKATKKLTKVINYFDL